MEIRLPAVGKSLAVGGEISGAVSVERQVPLPFGNSIFTAVFDFDLDDIAIIKEYSRVLKFNGRLCFETEEDEYQIREALDRFRIVKRKVVGVYRVNIEARKT